MCERRKESIEAQVAAICDGLTEAVIAEARSSDWERESTV